MGLFGGSSNKGKSTGGHGHGTSGTSAGAGTEQYRSVYLLVYPSAMFKAHWGLFIPESSGGRVQKGTMIHVRGSVKEGFEMEFRRNYDIDATRTRPRTPLEIGLVSTQHLADTRGDGTYTVDRVPRDAIENIIASVPAPTQSLNSVSAGGGHSGPPRRVELSDCQWWTLRVVEKLVEHGYLIPPTRGLNKNMNPVDIVKGADRH